MAPSATSLPLRVCVVDDEMIARKRVLRLLGEIAGIEYAREVASGKELLALLEVEQIDVVLLDIQMPELDGLTLARTLPAERPYLIFLTAHPNHALEAFEVGAIDYLLKPVDTARLEKALDRARTFLDRDEGSRGSGVAPAVIAKLPVQTKAGVVLVAPADITHAVLENELVTMGCGDKTYITDFTLGELEAKLPAPPFVRVHRKAILNVERVVRFEPQPSGGYLAHVPGGHAIDVSRAVARKLRRSMGI